MQFLDLVAQYQHLKPEMDDAVQRVLASGYFVMGPELQALETEIADFLEVDHAVGCASGTDALQVALMAQDIGRGDEVITPAFTFVATVEVIALLGATPVYVDIDPVSYTIDPAAIEDAITDRTRAIIPVHLYGQCANIEEILEIARRHDLTVIEDAAQAIGATRNGRYAGTFGDIGCVSFFPSKNLGAYGDGGMMVTNDAETAERLRMISKHGSRVKYQHETLGVNSRLDALQAAVLRVKLPHLRQWNAERAAIAKEYKQGMTAEEISLPEVLPGNTHVYHQFSIQVPDRDDLRDYLQEHDIPTAIHYPIPLHHQPAFREVGRNTGLPVSERVAAHILSLPIYPEMPEADRQKVIETVSAFFA